MRAATAALILCGLLSGCERGEDRRSSVAFHAAGVRLGIQYVKEQIAREQPNYYAMVRATAQLERALLGLPGRVEKKATTRVQERKAAAERAIRLFSTLKPTLHSLKFDKAKILAELGELENIIAEVEKQ